jgi:hypothetical protein
MDWRLFWSKCRLWLGERVVNYFLYGAHAENADTQTPGNFRSVKRGLRGCITR